MMVRQHNGKRTLLETVLLTTAVLLILSCASLCSAAAEDDAVTVPSGSTISAKAGTQYQIENVSEEDVTTLRFRAPVTGILNVDGLGFDGDVYLTDESGFPASRPLRVKTLDGTAAPYLQTAYFTVTKGRTYGIRLGNLTPGKGRTCFAGFQTKAYRNDAGQSKAKAFRITDRKAHYAVLANDGLTDNGWMKVRVKKGTHRLKVQALTDDGLEVRLSFSAGKLTGTKKRTLKRSDNGPGNAAGTFWKGDYRTMKVKVSKPGWIYLRASRTETKVGGITGGVLAVKVVS